MMFISTAVYRLTYPVQNSKYYLNLINNASRIYLLAQISVVWQSVTRQTFRIQIVYFELFKVSFT